MLETLPRCEFCFGILEKSYLAGDLNLTKLTPGIEPSDLGEGLPDLWHLPCQELQVPDKQNHHWTCPKRNLFLKVFIFFTYTYKEQSMLNWFLFTRTHRSYIHCFRLHLWFPFPSYLAIIIPLPALPCPHRLSICFPPDT